MTGTKGFIDVSIVGTQHGVEAMLLHLERVTSPPMIGAWLETSVTYWLSNRARERFDTEGDDVTGPWMELGEYSQRRRAEQGYGSEHPINVRTGELEDYIVNSDGDVTIAPMGATLKYPGPDPVGDLAIKVETAQVGMTDSNGNYTPPRPVLGMNTTDLQAILVSLAQFIQRG